jgi:hypothetical protein
MKRRSVAVHQRTATPCKERIMQHRVGIGVVVVMATVVGLGCGDDPTAAGEPTIVTAISPPGGAVDVDPAGAISITFSRPMQMGMEAYAALHQGSVTGPEIEGTWSWMDGGERLQFVPTAPLASATMHTVHLGGGMMDANGDRVGLDSCVTRHGGQWATGGMMGGGMMAGGDMMGTGWQGADSTYGMLYTFTTR